MDEIEADRFPELGHLQFELFVGPAAEEVELARRGLGDAAEDALEVAAEMDSVGMVAMEKVVDEEEGLVVLQLPGGEVTGFDDAVPFVDAPVHELREVDHAHLPLLHDVVGEERLVDVVPHGTWVFSKS